MLQLTLTLTRLPHISIHIVALSVGHVSISGVDGPIAMKFGMNVDLWTLMTWDSDLTLLTGAPREGQGPSNTYTPQGDSILTRKIIKNWPKRKFLFISD